MSLKDPPKATYISIRDDDGLRSLSRNERAFTRECALGTGTFNNHSRRRRSLRVDGRTMDQVRPVRLHLGRWDHGSECTVQWGNTRVTSLCTAELVRPNLDRPNEGQLVISVDLSPSASPSFRHGPPSTTGGGGGSSIPNYAGSSQRLASNRILRCIEKIIVTGGTLDVEALCLIPAQWVWRFQLALTVLDDGGNVMDAAVMAAIASLRHYRKPQVDMIGDTEDQGEGSNSTGTGVTPVLIPSHLKEPTPLPLHHTPLAISFSFCPMEDGSSHSTATNALSSTSSSGLLVAALVDPTDREELLQNGSLTVGMNIHAEVCLLDYGGGCELPPNQLEECWKKAEKSIRQLCTMLETSLEEADEQAQKDRLSKLQQQQWPGHLQQLPQTTNTEPDLPPLPTGPYFQQSDNPGGEELMELNATNQEGDSKAIRRLETEAEEAYKRNALDFTQGYQAQKVREDNDAMRLSSQPFFNQASSLFKQLMKSSQSITDEKTSTPTTKQAPEKKKDDSAKASTAKKSTASAPASSCQIDSDEEEAVEMLQSEFQTSDAPTAKASRKECKAMPMDVDDDDIDDLAMAISSKKKKKKKKTKK